jgi:hypothetical protein
VALLAITLAALWQARAWPWQSKLVPDTAAYIVLSAGTLNLITEMFFARKQQEEPHGHGAMDSVLLGPMPLDRTLRHFGWMVAFLTVAYGIGLLPGLFLLILLHSRFEFGERWGTALISAVAVTALSWIVFDRIFALVWPESILREMLPTLASGLHI